MDIEGPWGRKVELTKAQKAKIRRDAKRNVKPKSEKVKK